MYWVCVSLHCSSKAVFSLVKSHQAYFLMLIQVCVCVCGGGEGMPKARNPQIGLGSGVQMLEENLNKQKRNWNPRTSSSESSDTSVRVAKELEWPNLVFVGTAEHAMSLVNAGWQTLKTLECYRDVNLTLCWVGKFLRHAGSSVPHVFMN